MTKRTKMHHWEIIGAYAIELPHPRAFWRVRKVGAFEHLSEHNTKAEAIAAMKRYQTADARRALRRV